MTKSKTTVTAAPNGKELLFTCEFDAPRELVWKAWTDPKLIAQWWGPNGVTNPVCEFEARRNGALHIVALAGEAMGALKGSRWPMKGVVKEVKEPTRLVFTTTALRGDEERPILENLNTVTFEEHEGKTKVTLHIVIVKVMPEAEGSLEGMKWGWPQSFDKLAAIISTL
jgi:uncharacterized protein YndB with AHSA1/START domain